MRIEDLESEKQKIINQMYLDLENTREADQFFTIKNIRDCLIDLDKYIDLLSKSHLNKSQQKAISQSIKWIFNSLSTFKEKNENYDFLHGFIYNGYTEELSDFIVKTAFLFGFKKEKQIDIKTNVFYLKHNPHFLDSFRIYIGSDSSSNNSVLLAFNKKTSCFEFEENPYGESYGMPIFDLKINKDYSELSFNVLTKGSLETINLKAQRAIDKVLLKAIWNLNKKNAFRNLPKADFCQITLELNKGVLTELKTINYNSNNEIINMFTKGTGISIFVREIDNTGRFFKSENLVVPPKIVSEKFIIVDAVPKWKYYEIDKLEINENNIFITTKNQQFEYEAGNNSQIITAEIENKMLKYDIKTYDFMIDLLNELFILREPFSEI